MPAQRYTKMKERVKEIVKEKEWSKREVSRFEFSVRSNSVGIAVN